MQILFLKLENIKSYANALVEFTPGTNAIVGRNGAGKSTILEAIGFALFGHLPYNQNDFVNEGARSAAVTVSFASSFDERAYEVVRRCGASTAYYVYDPELHGRVCEGKADVTSFLRKHMGADPQADLGKLFSDAVGVPQGTLTAAFLQTPASRKGTFDPLLQVAEYAEAAARLMEPVRLLKEQQQALAVASADLSARLERLPELEARLARLAADLAQDRREQSEAAAGLAQLQARLQELEALRAQVERLRDQRNRAAQSAAALADALAAAIQRQEQAAAAQALVAAHQAGHGAYVAAQAAKAQLDAQVSQRQRLQQAQNRLDKALAQSQAELASLSRTLAAMATAAARATALIPQVAEQERLEQALAAARQQAADVERAAAALASAAAQDVRLRQRQSALQAEAAQAEGLHAQLGEIDQALAAAETIQEQQRSARIRVQAEIQSIQQQQQALADAQGAACPVCEQPLTPQHREEMLARNQARLGELTQAEQAAQSALAGAQKEIKALAARRKETGSALQQLPRPQEIQEVQAQIGILGQEMATLTAQAAGGAATTAQMSALSEALGQLGNPRQEQTFAQRTAQGQAQTAAQAADLEARAGEQGQTLAGVAAEVAAFAGLDGDLALVAARLSEHQPAYQAVLANQQLAATLTDQQAEVARLTQAQAEGVAIQAQAEAALATATAHFDAEAYAQTAAAERSLRGRQGELIAQIKLQETAQAQTQGEVQELGQRQAELTAIQIQQAQLGEQMGLLEAMRGVLRRAGPHITTALVQQISQNAARLFGEIMQDYSQRLVWGLDYGITLEVNGRERAFAQLSGGEQMAAALSVRLALLREMSSIDIAFFDEPTTNLDEARRESLAQQILGVKGFRQLFVISHDDTFEQATENLIRVGKVDGKSVIE